MSQLVSSIIGWICEKETPSIKIVTKWVKDIHGCNPSADCISTAINDIFGVVDASRPAWPLKPYMHGDEQGIWPFKTYFTEKLLRWGEKK